MRSGITIKGIFHPIIEGVRGTYYKVDLDRVGELREQARAIRNEADEKYRMSRSGEDIPKYFDMRETAKRVDSNADELLVWSDRQVKSGGVPAVLVGE